MAGFEEAVILAHRAIKATIGYNLAVFVPVVVSVMDHMIKTSQWPTAKDLPGIVGHSVICLIAFRATSPKNQATVDRANSQPETMDYRAIKPPKV